MKKSVLMLLMAVILSFCVMNVLIAQEQPKPKKDTVNQDTYAKPQFYYPVEDEKANGKSGKGNAATIVIIAGVVIVAGGAGFILLRKKK